MMQTVVCTECKWTSMAVTREFAESEVARFNEYFDGLSKEKQDEYYGGRKSSLAEYRCQFCGGTEFRPGNTAPAGSTIGPVIYEPQVTATPVSSQPQLNDETPQKQDE